MVYNRTSYSVFIIEIPRLRGKERKNAIYNYLNGLYPGDLEQKTIVIKKNGNKKWSYIVFVLDIDKAKIIKPIPSSTLFISRYFSGEDGNVVFISGEWMELFIIEKGSIIKNAVKQRDGILFSETMQDFFGTELSKLYIFCHEKERLYFFEQEYPFAALIKILETEQRKIISYKWSFFDNLSFERKLQKVFLLLFILISASTSIYYIYQYRKSIEGELRQKRQFEETQRQLLEEERKDHQLLAELLERYNDIINKKTATVYETIEVIANCLTHESRIVSATIKDGFFQLDLTSSDALIILKAFEENRSVYSPQLQQVHPENNRERFSLSGTVMPDIIEPNTSLPLKEQLAFLAFLLEEFDINKQNSSLLQASSFGKNIRTLLEKWRCTVNSYQYLNTENGKEIEFSINASSIRFFGFLQEASMDNSDWIITLLQIRNLAPENMLSVIIRIKAENITDEPFDFPDEYIESAPLPVERISRNYYTAAAVQQQAIQSLPEPEEPPSIPPPSPSPVVEQASHLVYVGVIRDNLNNEFIYLKNTFSGEMYKLEEGDSRDMQFTIIPSGNIIAIIDGKKYEIKRY
ncbi:MAG: cell division protein FtsL [Treponema sp.]|nr:cell division protein FtsL [Treponema sp.]